MAVERVRGPVDSTTSAQIVVVILSRCESVVSPFTWLFVAVIAAGPAVLVTRRWARLGVAGTLAIVFVSIRRRTHPALLSAGIVAVLAVLVVGSPRIREWTARPRRSHALGLAGSLAAATGIGAVPSPVPRRRRHCRPPAAAGLPSEWSATSDVWHLIVRERDDDELYHLPGDPLQEQNLILRLPNDQVVEYLRVSIAEMRRAPRLDAAGFRSLGYIH